MTMEKPKNFERKIEIRYEAPEKRPIPTAEVIIKKTGEGEKFEGEVISAIPEVRSSLGTTQVNPQKVGDKHDFINLNNAFEWAKTYGIRLIKEDGKDRKDRTTIFDPILKREAKKEKNKQPPTFSGF